MYIYGKSAFLLDQGNWVNLILIDFNKAFDRAAPSVILDSPMDCGASQECLYWIFNYIIDRQLRVKVGDGYSEFASISVETPPPEMKKQTKLMTCLENVQNL